MVQTVRASVVILCGAIPALAQTYQEAAPKSMTEASTAMEWLIVGAFIVGTLVVAFKPAKRSNLK